MTPLVLEMKAIGKTFPGVVALENVNLDVRAGEILAVMGENGAGKSTLMKVLSGVYPHGSYTGEIVHEGEACRFRSLQDSERRGIVIIHQELALAPQLSIAENIFLGNEQARYGVIDWHGARRRALDLMRKVGLDEDPDAIVGELGTGKQQLVEIARALAKKVRLLILDEPTASLSEKDSAALLDLIAGFRTQGMSAILISHKLTDVTRVADRITVLRDGRSIETINRADASEARIISAMVGRDMEDRYPKRAARIGAPLFEIRNWSASHPQAPERPFIRDASLTVREGEVVGLAGLMGAGRTELAMSVFGRSWGVRAQGETFLRGAKVDLSSVGRAIATGVAYATEDRKVYGLNLIDHIKHNVTMANLRGVSRGGVIDDEGELTVAQDYRGKTRLRCSSVYQNVGQLSGGNQQKVVLSKWLFAEPDLLILDEPTRGIDVGAKYEIYSIVNALAEAGKGILLISSEMPELLGVCDRIYVMNEGRIVDETPAAQASQESIMRAIVRSQEKQAS